MKIGMLFPDYGSQFVGMGKELYDNSRLIQEYFEEAFNCLDINFVKLCFASSDAELAKLENAYVSIFLISVATAALLKQENIVPTTVSGYGIGELSAICVADGLSFPDGLYFLNKFAYFYHESLATLSVSLVKIEGVSTKIVTQLIKEQKNGSLAIAVFESEDQHLISGTKNAVEGFKQRCAEQKIITRDLPVEKGLHSNLMDSVVNQLIIYLQKIDFKNISIPLIASVDGAIILKKDLVKRRIIKQIQAPIYWNKVLQQVYDWDIVIEIGPGTTLTKLVQQKYPEKNIFSINKMSDIEELKKVVFK